MISLVDEVYDLALPWFCKCMNFLSLNQAIGYLAKMITLYSAPGVTGKQVFTPNLSLKITRRYIAQCYIKQGCTEFPKM
jgi:hypothetical protein